MEQKELIEIQTGENINHFFILSKVEERTTKTGKPFLNLELRDKSSLISAKVWDGFDDFQKSAEPGKVVKVTGQMEEFNNSPQIKVSSIRIATKNDDVNPSDFMPKSSHNFEEMVKELEKRISQIKNEHLKQLINKILSGENYEKYKHVPAGKAWHHAYVHGLLEHTLEIIKICDLMSDIHPEINRDLLVCGAILHDFGKTKELNYETNFDYTDSGKLLGHIVIAAIEIEKAASTIKDFPLDLKEHLIHLVLSHQGKLEQASPVVPKTLEAITLYHADELSAKSNAYKYAIKLDENKGENWTRFQQLAGTAIFIPDKEKLTEEQETLFDN
ncbi:MAG: HD domain-containing protein [Melioribacteraceae bacterium]|nr:HD domain-containing protein [Melioribacteraceae bacterium]